MLVGIVNTALRNDFESLEDLCLTHAIDQSELVERLASAGYQYNESAGQFR